MPINAHPEFLAAEKEYLMAQTVEDKIEKLKKMISLSPGHKGAENLRAELKTRLKKLVKKQEKGKKRGKTGKPGIKKEELQVVIIGKTNAGKSSLISVLTNIHPQISEISFTTKNPVIGMMNYNGVNIQMIEVPAIESEYYDRGLVHTADLIIILVDEIGQINEIIKKLENVRIKILTVFNKIDLLDTNEKRKLEARLKSQKLDFVMISAKTGENLDMLKEKIFRGFGKLRIFTKEPGKPRSEKPIILEPNAEVKDVAEKIFKGFSKNVVEAKIWGPSSKFPGQKVGLNHVLKDLDVVEFKTR